jgi:predicted dehydrogenase
MPIIDTHAHIFPGDFGPAPAGCDPAAWPSVEEGRFGMTIAWGILGTGTAAVNFAEDLRRTSGAEIAAVSSRSVQSAQAFASHFAIPHVHGSWEDLAADSAVDLVYVALTNNAHYDASALCIQAGKAVLCEKPLTTNHADSLALVSLAEQRNAFLMEGMWMRCNPLVNRMSELVSNGSIGDVRVINADLGIRVDDPGHRIRDPLRGGGALLDLGTYAVSFAHLLLGMPNEIAAWSHYTAEGVDDHTVLVLGYDAACAVLSCGFRAETPSTAALSGTGGRIELSHDFTRPAYFTLHRDGRDAEVVRLPWSGHGLVHEAAEAMRCMKAGLRESPLVPWQASLEVARILDVAKSAGRASAEDVHRARTLS